MSRVLIYILCLFSFSVSADECAFDQNEQELFLNGYLAKNPEAEFSENKQEIIIRRDEEIISFSRGGCAHFGINIKAEILDSKRISEKYFLNKVISYTKEFGSELVKEETIIESINSKKYSIQSIGDQVYYDFNVPEVEHFESYFVIKNGKSFINVSFYIN